MDMAIRHFRNVIEHTAPFTLKHLEVGPYFPVDFSPGDPIGFSHESDEFLKVP